MSAGTAKVGKENLRTKLARALQVQGSALNLNFDYSACLEALDASSMDINKAAEILVSRCVAVERIEDSVAGNTGSMKENKLLTRSASAATVSTIASGAGEMPTIEEPKCQQDMDAKLLQTNILDHFSQITALLEHIKLDDLATTNAVQFRQLTKLLRQLNASLMFAVPAAYELGLPLAAVLPHHTSLAALPLEHLQRILQQCTSIMQAAVRVQGVLLSADGWTEASVLASHTGTELMECALEACYATVTILSAPEIDRRLHSDIHVATVMSILKHALQTVVIPLFCPTDPAWQSDKCGIKAPVRAPDAIADELDETFSIEEDEELEEGDRDASPEPTVKSSRGHTGGTIIRTSFLRCKRFIGQLADIFSRCRTLVNIRTFQGVQLDVLSRLLIAASVNCVSAALPFKANSRRSQSERKTEDALLLACGTLLQVVFHENPDLRIGILTELAAHHVSITSTKKCLRVTRVHSSLPRTYTPPTEKVADEVRRTFETSVHSPTVVACMLLHASVVESNSREVSAVEEAGMPIATVTPNDSGRKRKGRTPGKITAQKSKVTDATTPPDIPDCFSQSRDLCVFYVQTVLSWVMDRLNGSSGISVLPQVSALGISSNDDDCDVRLSVKRLCADLLCLFDCVEWPAASLMLTVLVSRALDLSKNPADGKGSKAMTPVAVGVLGLVVSRLSVTKLFAQDNSMTVQRRLPAPTGSVPASEVQTDEGVVSRSPECASCKQDSDTEDIMIACDVCNEWYHCNCVGLIGPEARCLSYWECDDCKLVAAFETLQKQIQAEVRTNSEGNQGSAAVDSNTDARNVLVSTAKKQLLLNFLTNQAYGDVYARTARMFYIGRWSAERGAGPLDAAVSRNYFLGQYNMPHQTTKMSAVLSPQSMFKLVVEELMSEMILQKYDVILSSLLTACESDTSKTRATLVKSLADIVCVAPESMRLSSVSTAVRSHLQDVSIAVRSEALDLIGKYVTASPSLLREYLDTLIGSLHDDGISVRKKAVEILKELLRTNAICEDKQVQDASAHLRIVSNSPVVRVWNALFERASDDQEEETVRDSAREALINYWCEPPSLTTKASNNVAAPDEQKVYAALRKQVALLGNLVAKHNSTLSSSGGLRVHAAQRRMAFGGSIEHDKDSLLQIRVRRALEERKTVLLAMADSAMAQGKDSQWMAQQLHMLLGGSRKVPGIRISDVGEWDSNNVFRGIANHLWKDFLGLSAVREQIILSDSTQSSDDGEPSEAMDYAKFVACTTTCLDAICRLFPSVVAGKLDCLLPHLTPDSLLLDQAHQSAVQISLCNMLKVVVDQSATSTALQTATLQENLSKLILSSNSLTVISAACAAMLAVQHGDISVSATEQAKRKLPPDAVGTSWFRPFVQASFYDSLSGPRLSAQLVARHLLVVGLMYTQPKRAFSEGASVGSKRPRSQLGSPGGSDTVQTPVKKRSRLIIEDSPAHESICSTSSRFTEEGVASSKITANVPQLLADYTAAALAQSNAATSLAMKNIKAILNSPQKTTLGGVVSHPIVSAVRDYESIACAGIIGTANAFCKQPAVILRHGVRDVFKQALSHQLPYVKETALWSLLQLMQVTAVHAHDATGATAAVAESAGDVDMSTAKTGGTLEDSDASIITGVVQELFDPVCALTADATPEDNTLGIFGSSPAYLPPFEHKPGSTRVRALALRVLMEILRHGIVDPDSCVAPTVAALTDVGEPHVHDTAYSIFKVLVGRYANRIEAKLVGGVTASFYYQNSIYGTASSRFVTPNGTVASTLNDFYRVALLPNKVMRGNFLRQLVQRCFPDALNASAATAAEDAVDMPLCRYLIQAAMYLPYQTEDEVVLVVASINRLLAIHAENVLRSLQPYLDNDGADESVTKSDEEPATRHTLLAAWVIILLLAAKRHLKSAYDLRDAKIASFDLTIASSKLQERQISASLAVMSSDVAVLPVPPPCILEKHGEITRNVLVQTATLVNEMLSDAPLTSDLGKLPLLQSATFKRTLSKIGNRVTRKNQKSAQKAAPRSASKRKAKARSKVVDTDSEEEEEFEEMADTLSADDAGDADETDGIDAGEVLRTPPPRRTSRS